MLQFYHKSAKCQTLDPFFFPLTVRENVTLSEECTQKTDEDVLAALRQSGFADESVNDAKCQTLDPFFFPFSKSWYIDACI